MNKRKLLQLLRETVTPERRRSTAYHEAGHAAMKWMFGQNNQVEYISMVSTLDHVACVGCKRNILLYNSPDATPMRVLDKTTQGAMRFLAKCHMMHLLAGYAVESRLANPNGVPEDAVAWLDIQLDEGEWEDEDNKDLNEAVRIAKYICGDSDNARRMVRRMSVWTDEAVLHPRLWAVIKALAEQLLTIKTRMSGDRVRRIMKKAWGESNTLVHFLEMGRQWRQRFPFR